MLGKLSQQLTPNQKRALKAKYAQFRKAMIDRFRAYDYDDFAAALTGLGVRPGDVLMVHSTYSNFNGFKGTPQDIVKALRAAVGPEGTLLMLSMPYNGSTKAYLDQGKPFDVKKTFSRMGLLTEIFRRQKDVVRSLSPTHPFLATGPLADWFIAGHENCLHACGPGSPFEKLVERNAKMLLFDVAFGYLTFYHYLEHLVKDDLPMPLYDEHVYEVPVIDADGDRLTAKAVPYALEIIPHRRTGILEQELARRGQLPRCRVGNTHLTLVGAADALAATREMAAEGKYFYEFGGAGR